LPAFSSESFNSIFRFREALKTYTVLTVGDGLVTLIPSLLVSMARGMVVTRASSNATLSADLGTQLLSRPRSLQIAAGVMVALACIPGLPKFSFLTVAAVVMVLAWRLPSPIKDKNGKVIEVADPGALPAPKILSLGEVQKVLQQLLREQVSVRDLPSILETLLDTSGISKNPVLLVEAARQGLGRALVRPLLSEDGGLRVLTLDHNLEEELSRAFNPQAPPANSTGLQPSFVRRILDSLRQLAGDQVAQTAPILLCGTPARFHLRRLLEPFLPKVVVLSPLEIPPMVPVQSLGTVR
jgi:flagellar biosynthesis component FlhA